MRRRSFLASLLALLAAPFARAAEASPAPASEERTWIEHDWRGLQ